MTRLIILILGLALIELLSGCAGTIPADPTHMSPEQLRENAKDRSANFACVLTNTPWGPQRVVYGQLDKGTVVAGRINWNADCSGFIEAEQKAPKPAAAVGAPGAAP